MEKSSSIEGLNNLDHQFLSLNMIDKDQPENLKGNFIQHKIDSKNLNQIKWSKLQQLIQECIHEQGSCNYSLRIYNLITEDEIIPEIVNKVKKISEGLNCSCDITNAKQGIFGFYLEFFLQNKLNPNAPIQKMKKNLHKYEVKLGTFGEESSGKSTTTSVLVNNELDDGKGGMSKKNYKSQHEFQSGKSLYLSHLILGLDDKNEIIKEPDLNVLIKKSSKFINIYDMGGSDKAMKNTLSLISPDYIDYALLFIDYKNGPTENTRKLYSLNHSVHIPIICIITMIDLVENQNEQELLNFIKKVVTLLTSVNEHLKELIIRTMSDINDYISKLSDSGVENYLPILCISNVKGNNLDLLQYFIKSLPNTLSRTIPLITNSYDDKNFDMILSPINQFDVHEHFNVGQKMILGGIVSKGIIKKNEKYFLGPNKIGNFKCVQVDTIHCKKQDVDEGHEGQFISLSLSGIDYDPSEVSKGMCLIGTNTNFVPKSSKKFKAEVWYIGEEQIKEIKYKYEPVVIINHIREACKIINMKYFQKQNKSFTENSSTTSGYASEYSMPSKTTSFVASSVENEEDFFNPTKKKKKIKMSKKDETFFLGREEKKELIFEFKNFPKFLSEGQTIIINDNNFKAFGIITKVIYPEDEKTLFNVNPMSSSIK